MCTYFLHLINELLKYCLSSFDKNNKYQHFTFQFITNQIRDIKWGQRGHIFSQIILLIYYCKGIIRSVTNVTKVFLLKIANCIFNL